MSTPAYAQALLVGAATFTAISALFRYLDWLTSDDGQDTTRRATLTVLATALSKHPPDRVFAAYLRRFLRRLDNWLGDTRRSRSLWLRATFGLALAGTIAAIAADAARSGMFDAAIWGELIWSHDPAGRWERGAILAGSILVAGVALPVGLWGIRQLASERLLWGRLAFVTAGALTGACALLPGLIGWAAIALVDAPTDEPGAWSALFDMLSSPGAVLCSTLHSASSFMPFLAVSSPLMAVVVPGLLLFLLRLLPAGPRHALALTLTRLATDETRVLSQAGLALGAIGAALAALAQLD